MRNSPATKANKLDRPSVTLKIATSLDGKIAMGSGESKWITGPDARAAGHTLRSEHQAILTGSGTVLADDPELTCRIPDYDGPQPARFILDRRGRTPDGTRLAQTQDISPVKLFTIKAGSKTGPSDMVHHVCTNWQDAAFLDEVLGILKAEGFESLMVEGGGQLMRSFINLRAVDRIEWFRAPIVIGSHGLPAVAGLEAEKLSGVLRLTRERLSECGDDIHESYNVRT